MGVDQNKTILLDIKTEIKEAMLELGFNQLTPIQEAVLEPLLKGADVTGQAKTGSGKTVAFSIPLLQCVNVQSNNVQAVIVCPTRELAQQVSKEVRKLGRKIQNLKVALLVGGIGVKEQVNVLEADPHVLVATPGRLVDLIDRGLVDLSQVKYFVLDEADKMFELGFKKEMKAIFKKLPQKRQTVFFSATFHDEVLGLSRSYQIKPVFIGVENGVSEVNDDIEHILYDISDEIKIDVLMRVLHQHEFKSALVFCNQKITAQEILEKIKDNDGSVIALHGDLDQKDREKAIILFRNRSYRLLVATDVASRGLDIENLDLIISYDLPPQAETYVHRAGRTGRAGHKGVSVLLASQNQELKIGEYEGLVKKAFQRPKLGFKHQHGVPFHVKVPDMQTLMISSGKKDKLRAGDILGALTSTQELVGSDIGKIDILENVSYVALKYEDAEKALNLLRQCKIKGRKIPVKILNT